MSLIEHLLERKSHGRLTAPAPSKKQMEKLFQLALRAPDHAQLRPWRYLVFEGDALQRLGQLFVEAQLVTDPDLSKEKQQKLANKPLRAPMVVVSLMSVKPHKKVPEIEQILSSGAAVQNLLMAAHLSDIGAMWRTGSLAFNRHLMDRLGLADNEQITGFIYLGQEEGRKASIRHPEPAKFIQWFDE
jgi:nitroreductase